MIVYAIYKDNQVKRIVSSKKFANWLVNEAYGADLWELKKEKINGNR